MVLYIFCCFAPTLSFNALSIKRLRDLGEHWTMFFLALVPILNFRLWPYLLFVQEFQRLNLGKSVSPREIDLKLFSANWTPCKSLHFLESLWIAFSSISVLLSCFFSSSKNSTLKGRLFKTSFIRLFSFSSSS